MRILYFKRALLFMLLFAVGWVQSQTIQPNDSRGSSGALNGAFSVSENSVVCFSKGNLQYRASTNTWRFAEHQWDYVGGTESDSNTSYGNVYENDVQCDNNLRSSTYAGWIDLFGWGTSGYNHGASCYQPWSVEAEFSYGVTDAKYYAYGNKDYDLNSQTGKADWGYNAISNGSNEENFWRTLTKDEWVYLLNTRETPSGIRFAHAVVNGVVGLIILPDDWDSSIFTLNDVNNGTKDANPEENVIGLTQWAVLEENGAVFLPKNGFMYLDQYGYAEFNYWSSTHADDNNAYNFCYNDYIFQVDASYFRHIGMGVRLVTTAYQVKATINPAGTGTVEGTGAYALGETCTITAVPNEGYAFVGWSIDGEIVSRWPSVTFPVDQDYSLVANFAAVRTISASVNPSSGGAIAGLYDFEDGKQGWTTIDNDGDGHNWIESYLYSYSDQYDYLSGNVCMMSASYDEDNDETLTPDNWLVSPQVELGGSVSLWACGLDSYDPEEHFAIYVSTSGTNVGDFSQVTDEYVTGDKMAEYVADLSEYAGMGYIAIRHFNCTDQYYLLVDDIDIVSPSLSMNHLEGEPSSLLALPNAGYEFVNWTKDGVEVSTDVEYSFDVSGDESFVANFVENNNTYEITVAASPETAGVVTGGGTYLHNAVCTLTATPAEGYVFVAWTENEETVSTDAEYRFRATQERILVAEFVPIYTVNISATPSGGGTVLFEDANLYEITVGTDETISNSYVPVCGFLADYYLKCETVYPADELSEMMGKDIDGITYYSWHSNTSWGNASFRVFLTEVESDQIDAFVGEGTVVYEGPLSIDDNGEMLVSFTAPYRYNGGNLLVGVYNTVKGTRMDAPWHGEVREGVSVQGYSVSSLDAITPTQRNFMPKTTFAYESGINEKTYPSGETCTLLARPNEGYEFDSWRENGEVVSESPSYSFEVLSDRSLEAYFEGNGSYLLSLNAVPEEAGKLFANLYYEIETPFAPSERIEEQDISVVAAANKGWRFAYWTSNGEVIPANNVYNFHLSEDTELVAHFEPCEVATEPDPDLLSGRFSISGCTTVGFAKGNVIAQIQIDTINDLPVATSASWQFAETQYYRQEYDAEAIAENGIGNLLSEGMDLVYDVYRSIGLVDIGCWHLLSSAEWDYLLNGRPIEIRYAFATVNGVAGLLVLPDDWAAATYELDSPNEPAAYETNEIALADWQTTLEPAGALFLPANGMLMCPPTVQGQCQYQLEANNGSSEGSYGIVGSYGNMVFNPTMGIITATSYPIMGYVWAEAGGYFSMRLAQVVEQATSTVAVSVKDGQADYGTVSGGDSFACGAECTVVAIPNEGYVFRYWLEDGEVASVDAEYTFKVAGDRALVAVFAEDNTVCNIQFELFSDESFYGLLGWGGEALQLRFNDGTPDISLTIPVPEVDWNAVVVGILAGNGFDPSSYGFPLSRIYTIPINRGASVTLSWMASSLGEDNEMEFSNTFSVSNESGEIIIENAGKDNMPSGFQSCGDIDLSVDPEDGGSIESEGALVIGESVTLTAVANEGYHFVNWTLNGVEVSTDPIYSFEVTQAGEMVAHFQLNTYEITATAIPAEGGTITGGGTYSHGATCVLTASPNTGYVFSAWTEDGETVSTEATYSFTVTGERNLEALFLAEYTVTVMANPNEGGQVLFDMVSQSVCDFEDGAIPAAWNNSESSYPWTIRSTNPHSGTYCMASSNYNVANSESYVDATVVFAQNGSIDFYSRISSEKGCDVGCFFIDDTQMLSEGGTSPNSWTPHHFDVTAGTHVFRWSYSKDYSVNSGEDRYFIDDITFTGVVEDESNSYVYLSGETCTLLALPNDGYAFVNWTENGEEVSTEASYSFTVTSNRDLVANFGLDVFEITAVSSPETAGTITGAGTYDLGALCTLTATANTGYTFVNWTENGEVVATEAEYAFTVEGNRTLQANFSPNSYEISALVTPEAAGTVTGTGTYEYGTTCTLTAIPNEGYAFLKWADFYWNYESTYEFTVTGDAQFTAIFEALPNGVYVGTGGGKTNPYLPTYTGSNYSITQQIYTSSEIGDAMEIVNLSYYNEGGENTRVLDIYMAHTDVESIPTDAPNTGWVALTEDNLVFSGSVTMKQGCWNTIYLDAPFAYDGSTNVAIVVNDKTGSSTSNYLNCRVYNANGVQAILDYGSTSYDPLNPPQAWSYYGNPAIKNQIIFNRFCTVTASSDPEQGGTVAGTGTFACGSQCTLVATPNEGYAFQYWLENGEVVSYNAAYSFTVAGDHTLVAHFEPSCMVEPQNVLVSDLGVTEATVSWTSENDLFELRYRKGLGATTDFEQGIPYGWTTIDADGDGYNWRTYYNLGYNGSIGAASASWNGNVLYPDNYLVTPRVDLGGTFSFYACALDSDCAAEHFGVAVSTTGQTVASEFVTVQEWTLTAKKRDGLSNVLRGGNRDQGTWYHYSVDLSSYAGQSGYIAIRHFGCSNQYYLVIDDVQYVPDNEWTVVTGLNTTSYTLTNLEDMGDYIVEVRSSCGDGIGYSDWVLCTFNNEMHYTITAVANPTDWGTVTGAGTYPANDLIQLKAIANEGYGFLFWTENGEVVADDATYVFTVTEDRDLVAHFAPNTQTYSLTPGWSWISTYIEQEGPEGLAMLEEGLNPNGVMIKSQLDGFLSYVSGIGMWVGTLDAIANEKMYMVHLLDNAEFTLTGTPASATAHPITMYPNWNWVGYPSLNPADLNDALANLNASNDDVIKSMSGFASFDENFGWWGTLGELIPGEGYMYQSHNTQPIELTYPFDLNRSPKTNVTPESSHWKAAVHAYPNNMNLIAVVELDGEELQEDRYELAAFVGDECRGSARLSYVEPLRRYVAFLTVAGEEAADFCLALYDTETGKAYMNTTDCLGFEADAVMGSLRSPYVVRFEGATGMDESFAHAILLHPNPVSKGEVFQLELPAENDGARVSLVNALGEVVSVADLNAKPATMCAPTSPGVYVVRIETRSHGTYCKKLIVK